jgi:hypothetical protein
MRKEIKDFQNMLNNLSGCSLQDGNSCNSCFHSGINAELGLSDDMTHLLWIIHLILRGDKDYSEKDVITANKEFFEHILTKIEGGYNE